MSGKSPEVAPTQAYLACAEPSWSKRVSAGQLSGLLTLSALLSERLYLSDVHLGDNPHLLASYSGRHTPDLYKRLQAFTESGLIGYLLRDETVRPRAVDAVVTCESFSDVYRSWLAADVPAHASIVPLRQSITRNREPSGEPRSERLRFFADLDEWIPARSVQRYRYRTVKRSFMDSVRSAYHNGSDPWLRDAVRGTGPTVVAAYEALVEEEWFSLGDVHDLFQRSGQHGVESPMMAHGLLNELAYGGALGASLVGADVKDVSFEERFWPAELGERDRRATRTLDVAHSQGELLERAARVVDAPALSMLRLLSAEEVVALRDTHGRGYFDLLRLMDDVPLAERRDVEARFVSTAANYWEAICDQISRFHSAASHRPRKLAILLGTLPSSVRHLSSDAYTFGVNVGVPAASELLPAKAGALAAAKLLEQGMRSTLRFVFFAEANELKRLRRVLPANPWVTRSNPTMPSS